MAKLHPISGFPEWLPEEKIIEDDIVARIEKIYRSFGFSKIETPAVELIEHLTAQGVVDKEIYKVVRLQADDDTEASLGLHFDLTVPFARYTAQHLNNLNFPFKRYQLQKVWRGERPQKGRFREFYQFDVDIVGREELPLAADAEILEILGRAIASLKLGSYEIRVSNRKILQGFYSSLGIDESITGKVIVAVDKIDKIGRDGVKKELTEALSLSAEQSEKILKLAGERLSVREISQGVLSGNEASLVKEGIEELLTIDSVLSEEVKANLVFDGSLARGLAYYTGLIFEIKMVDYLDFGTVSSGGRYENLASGFSTQKLPGVGGSIGLSRLMDLILSRRLIENKKTSRAQVFFTVLDEEQRAGVNVVANQLRGEEINVETALKTSKLGKQIELAEKKGIDLVLFANEEGFEIKKLSDKSHHKFKTVQEIISFVKSQL